MCTGMHTDTHTHTHTHTACKHSQSKGNELMESQHTTLGAKVDQLVVEERERERVREREKQREILVSQKEEEN